jgi:LAO/AO transport system kinase
MSERSQGDRRGASRDATRRAANRPPAARRETEPVVVGGLAQPPPSWNPRLRVRGRARRMGVDDYVAGILAGDRSMLARAITLIESGRPEDRETAEAIVERCLPHAGRSIRVGVSGVPGVGKSTFLEALGTRLTARGDRVAVLAIDPSSRLSGGSILGDKTRMPRLAGDEGAFIRPSPSGGTLGGVARRTRETMLLCEAAGFSRVFVETVGVGQSETAVHAMVDFFLVLMLAGAGDELQGIKRGILELTDLLAIHKADGDNAAAARRAEHEFAAALHLLAPRTREWQPRVIRCSAVTGLGIDAVWDAVLEHDRRTRESGSHERRRASQRASWMHEMIAHTLEQRFRRDPAVSAALAATEQEVRAGQLSPFRAARDLLAIFDR